MTAKSRSIALPNTYTEDPRWVDAGADAFALHIAGCCYADRSNTDGRIDVRLIPRICLAVPPEKSEAAAGALVKAGFWIEENGSYQIVKYLDDGIGFSADEQDLVRTFWANDKKRRRHHNNGVHDLCSAQSKCEWVKINGPWAGPGQVPEMSRTVREKSQTVRGPYPTPPDLKGRGGRNGGAAKSRPVPGADAPVPSEPSPPGDSATEEEIAATVAAYMKQATGGK